MNLNCLKHNDLICICVLQFDHSVFESYFPLTKNSLYLDGIQLLFKNGNKLIFFHIFIHAVVIIQIDSDANEKIVLSA